MLPFSIKQNIQKIISTAIVLTLAEAKEAAAIDALTYLTWKHVDEYGSRNFTLYECASFAILRYLTEKGLLQNITGKIPVTQNKPSASKLKIKSESTYETNKR